MKLYKYLEQQKDRAAKLVEVSPGVLAPLKLSLEESQKLKAIWKQASREVSRRIYKQRYRQTHIAELNSVKQLWRQKNPGKVKEYYHVRRARKVSALGRFSGKEWTEMCVEYRHCCVACFRTNIPLVADHVVSLAAGGSNHISNIQPLCGPCNSRKGVQCTDYRKDFFVRFEAKCKKWQDLAQSVAVKDFGQNHVTYDSYDSSQKTAGMV